METFQSKFNINRLLIMDAHDTTKNYLLVFMDELRWFVTNKLKKTY